MYIYFPFLLYSVILCVFVVLCLVRWMAGSLLSFRLKGGRGCLDCIVLSSRLMRMNTLTILDGYDYTIARHGHHLVTIIIPHLLGL